MRKRQRCSGGAMLSRASMNSSTRGIQAPFRLLSGGAQSLNNNASASSALASGFVYYDMSVQNNSTTDWIPDAFQNTSSTQAILPSAKDYSVAVIRFSIPSDSVPLLKQLSVAGSVGTFTNGSTQVTNVSNPYSTSQYQSGKTGLFAQTINNFAVGMVISSAKRWPAKDFTDQPVISAVTYSSDPSICTLTLETPYAGISGTYSFDASLFWIAVRNPTTGTTNTQLVLSPPAATAGSILYYNAFYDEIPDTFQEVVEYFNEVLTYAYWEVTEADTVTQPDPSFFVLQESTNLIQYYESITSKFQTYVSHQMYNLLQGLPDQNYEAASISASFPITEGHRLLSFDTGYASGLNTVALTPSANVFAMDTTNLSPTVTFPSNNAVYPIFVGMTVTGTGIPPATTVTAVTAPTSITISNNATATNTGVELSFTDPAYSAFRMTQAASSLPFWTPLQRIVLTTSTIPVTSQALQPATPLSAGQAVTASTNTFRPILTDFEPISGINDYLPFQYYPQGPWRFTGMLGAQEVRATDLQVFWIDFNGNFIPFLVPPTKTSSKLLVFVRNDIIAHANSLSMSG